MPSPHPLRHRLRSVASSLRPVPRRLRIAAAISLATLAAGCWRPLAVQHEYFAPLNGSVARVGAQAQHVVNHHRALQAARHACATWDPAAAAPQGLSPGAGAARAALSDLCVTAVRPSPAGALGGTSNAYRRWVDDEVRELPAASETAAGAAGDS